MTDRLRKRIGISEREGGFTLIELLVVLIIIAVLLAIAIPAYLGFKDRAERRAAQSNVRIAVPSAEAYGEDNNGVYTGMDLAALKAIDPALSPTVVMGTVTANTYCIASTVGNHTYHFKRDAADATENVVKTGACA